MRREGVVYSEQRRQHIATNRTVHKCRCMQRPEDYKFVVETNDAKQAKEDEKNAAELLVHAWQSKEIAVVLPSDLETVGLYSVDAVADMDATHLDFVERQSNHHDDATRDAAQRLATKYKKMEDERKAMQTLGLGAHRHRDSLTKMERRRVEQLATTPPAYSRSDVLFRITFVNVTAEIAPKLELELRGCETYGLCTHTTCKCRECTTSVRSRWRYSKDDEEDEDNTNESDDEGDEDVMSQSPSKIHISLFDFVDAAMTRMAQSGAATDDEYDMCALQSDDEGMSSTCAE
ncbi:Aste57867_13163 [Aphanomyces stellatus]|uniref:Aste57867_13163 protein n=1 Tax=Aphanomyces stellatus TaxID=120398 RepID=A0A485KZH8_9STRA|nr:hypothetical protein As57867_013114 [Aphanomyces stellatus]VFT90004.1 Aste57867_13163 [Aphanomyces stellatus]